MLLTEIYTSILVLGFANAVDTRNIIASIDTYTIIVYVLMFSSVLAIYVDTNY